MNADGVEVEVLEAESVNVKEKLLHAIQTMMQQGVITKSDVLRALGVMGGRKAPPLPEFTFPGSGITVQIRRLGPFTLDAITARVRTQSDPPKPPMKAVNYGDADHPDIRMEPNTADETYQQAMKEYEKQLEEAGGRELIETIITHAVECDVDLEEVQATRAFLERMGVPKEDLDAQSDKEIYIKHVCIKTGDDFTGLQAEVIGKSVPTEAKIQAQEDAFRGHVPGEADPGVQHTPVGNQIQADA